MKGWHQTVATAATLIAVVVCLVCLVCVFLPTVTHQEDRSSLMHIIANNSTLQKISEETERHPQSFATDSSATTTQRFFFYAKGERLNGYFKTSECRPPSHWSDYVNNTVESEQECLSFPEDPELPAIRKYIGRKLKESHLKLVVWFFAGRRGYVDINLPYIKTLIKANGGMADYVLWIWIQGQEYILDIIANEKSGQFVGFKRSHTLRRMYRNLKPGHLYVKIDDDVVFIRPGSLEYMVQHYFKNPACTVVSGNIINNPGLTPVHQYIGALDALPFRSVYDGRNGNFDGTYRSPLEWAWSHINFLRRLTTNTLDRYDFGAWNFNCDGVYKRWTINFLTYKMDQSDYRELRLADSLNKDEVYLTHTKPEKEKGITCAVGKAVAVHFFHTAQSSLVRRRVPQGVNSSAAQHPELAMYLLSLYKAVSTHIEGGKKCCKATQCPVYNIKLDRILRNLADED